MRNGSDRRLAARLGALAGALLTLSLATSAQAYGGEGTVEEVVGTAGTEFTIQSTTSASVLQKITVFEGPGGIQGVQVVHMRAIPDPGLGRTAVSLFARPSALAGKAEGKQSDLAFNFDPASWTTVTVPRSEQVRLVIAYFEGAHLIGLEFATNERSGLMLGRQAGATFAATLANERINLLLGFNLAVGADGIVSAIGLIHDGAPLGPVQTAQLTGAPTTARPGEQYAGCPLPTRPAKAPQTPQGDVVDATSGLIFASMTYDKVASGAADAELRGEQKAACWFRIDGVWGRGDLSITFDASKNDPNWEGQFPELAELTNGNYTTLPFYVIQSTPGTDDEITVIPALNPSGRFTMRSTDGVPLAQVLVPYGNPPPPAKTYVGGGKTAVLRVERGGQINFTIDGVVFNRPAPGVTLKEITNQERANNTDPFLLSYTVENARASRVGYDITTTDPIQIADHPKQEVFENVDPKAYYFENHYIVPLGFTMIPKKLNGTIFTRTTVASEREAQSSVASTYGASLGYGQKDKAGNLQGSASVGVDYATKSAIGHKNEDVAAMALGLARAKKYALVVDYPYIRLHPRFLAAIEIARREGTPQSYQYIIDTFGTHYPYAVTYGAAAYAAQSFRQDTVAAWAVEGKSVNVQAKAVIKGAEPGISYSRSEESSARESNQYGIERTEFLAINSSGSWSAEGFTAHDNSGFPILLDLRPLEELLNPIYFADEPEVVNLVRPKLHAAIQRYLDGRPKPSAASRMPAVWRFTANKLVCSRPPFAGITDNLPAYREFGTQDLKGQLQISFFTPPGMKPVAPITPFKTEGDMTKEMDCTAGTRNGQIDLIAGSITTLWGTPEQIAATRFMLIPAISEADGQVSDVTRGDPLIGDDPVAIVPSPLMSMPAATQPARQITGEYEFPKLNNSAPVIKLVYTLERIQ